MVDDPVETRASLMALDTQTKGSGFASLGDTPRAVMFLCAALFIFSFQDVMVKLLSDRYPAHQIVFVRAIIALPLMFMIVHYESGLGTLATRHPFMHAIRSFIGFGAFFFFYLALATMPLTAVVAIWFTAPLFITALAVPILGERVGWRRWSGILFGFAGAMVIIQPGAATFQPAALLPVLAAFCYSISALMGRKMGITESGSVMAFYMMITFFYMGGILGVAFAHLAPVADVSGTIRFLLLPWHMPTGVELAMFILIGVISSIGFWLIATAYRIGSSPTVAPFEYTSMIWATILSFLLWGEVPKFPTILGGLMIVASGVYVLKREAAVRDRPLAGRGVWRSRN
jgi:drug/metabolite transporter (DMT)-like permease